MSEDQERFDGKPFFVRDGERFVPQPACAGPWDPKSLNGRVVFALAAFQIEQSYDLDAYMPARLTVDMYRLPGFAPLEVQTRVVRDGKRIKVIDAELISEGVSYARATSQWLLRGDNAPSTGWSPPDWDTPAPEEVAARPGQPGSSMSTRPLSGGIGSAGKKQLWLHEARELVGGTPLTPFMRVAIVADLANPIANWGDEGLGYINSDVTLYLHRLPVDGWIGMDVVNHHATDGVAIGQVVLYDRGGAIGTSSVCGPAQRRMAGRPKS